MWKRSKEIACCLLVGLLAHSACFAYKITGMLQHTSCFYPRVYLAVINEAGGIYNASNADLIASAPVDSAGNFTITGNDLPDEYRFYRLYLTDDEHVKTAIVGGSGRNYILLALNNQTELNVTSPDLCMPYFLYYIAGSPQSAAMAIVQRTLLATDSALRSTNAGTKAQFLSTHQYASLKQFADTTHQLMAMLWAVSEMHPDSNYIHDQRFFDDIAARFRKSQLSPSYAAQLDEQLRVLRLKNGQVETPWQATALMIMCSLLAASMVLNIYLAKRLKKQASGSDIAQPVPVLAQPENEESKKDLIASLTIKEREILKMVNDGLSNKEIAEQLFVEVSTVKSHISNIYQKMAIKSRKEVAGIVQYL
jgi:DNA-binding CsgD family transcriptional regulator